MPLNTYCSIEEVKAIADTDPLQTDAVLLDFIEDSSRSVDTVCERKFYLEIGIRSFDPPKRSRTIIDDLLSVFSVNIDSDFDMVTEQEVLATNYATAPRNSYPKTGIYIGTISPVAIVTPPNSGGIDIDGVWGYGEKAEPWELLSGETVTVADATTETLTVVASTQYGIGSTYRLAGILPNRDEYFYVEAKPSSTTLTVQRAVNGSTGAAHAGVTVSKIDVPNMIKSTVIKSVIRRSESEGEVQEASENIGGYGYTAGEDLTQEEFSLFTAQEYSRLRRLKRMEAVAT